MMQDADQRFAEIQDGLSDILTDLGVMPVKSTELATPIILFKTADGNQRSPVKLWISEPVKKGMEPSWGDCKIEVTDIEVDKVGDNGWVYLWVSSRNKTKLESDACQALAKIGQALRSHPLVPDWNAPHVTRDDNFAAAYEDIKDRVDQHDGSDVTCERADDVERYIFTDSRDRTWHIAYESDKAVVTVDNVYAESFDAADRIGLRCYIGDVMYDVPRI